MLTNLYRTSIASGVLAQLKTSHPLRHYWRRQESNFCRHYSVGSSDESKLTTSHVPLSRIFSGERDYLFSTKKNIRAYVWDVEFAEDLFDSLILTTKEEEGQLELSTMTLLLKPLTAKEKMDTKIGKESIQYDVSLRSVCIDRLSDHMVRFDPTVLTFFSVAGT